MRNFVLLLITWSIALRALLLNLDAASVYHQFRSGPELNLKFSRSGCVYLDR